MGFGAVIAADRGPDSPFWPSGCRNGGARLLFLLFLQRNAQANPVFAGVDGVSTAPKPVSLPMRPPKLHRNAFFCHRVRPHCTETRLAATGEGVWAFFRLRATRHGRVPAPVVRIPRPRPASLCRRPTPPRASRPTSTPVPPHCTPRPRPRTAPHAPACSDFFDFPQICAIWPSKAVFFWLKEGRQGDLRQRNAIDAGRPANVQR